MNPNEVLGSAGAELDYLREQLIRCDAAIGHPLSTIESLIEKLGLLTEELNGRDRPDLHEKLQQILVKAKRVQRLLEAGTAFHCRSIFGQPDTPDTYRSDGTLSPAHDSRIIFQG